MIRNNKIQILDNILVDNDLPKYKKEEVKTDGYNLNSVDVVGGSEWMNPMSPRDFSNRLSISGTGVMRQDSQEEYLEYILLNAPTFLNKFKLWLYRTMYGSNFKMRKEEKSAQIPLENLQKFFDTIKVNVNEINKSESQEILGKYFTILDNAKCNNQKALIEKIEDYASVLRYELILCNSKFNKFLNEEDIVEFYKVASVHEKFKTGLHLTYVKNFVKLIPEDVTSLKKEADALKVFDNYAILHYDYSGSSIEDTKKEKEKKKDPILFGLIQGSNKLYYIGDWIDEYCDLTLDVIIKKLGKEAGVISKETVENDLKKI